jgi:hypothetical protein
VDDAIRKVNKFGRKLIAWFEHLLGSFAVDRGDTFHFAMILVRIFQPKLPFRANKIVMADIGRAEAAREHCYSLVRKSHDRADHFLDFRETLFAVVRGQSNNLDRLVAKEVAGCVDTMSFAPESPCVCIDLFGVRQLISPSHAKSLSL